MNVGYKSTKQGEASVKSNNAPIKNTNSVQQEKYVVWHIEGGLGKNIAATALVEDVAKKYSDRKLVMVVSYPEIFLNNPFIYRVYRVGMTSYFYEDYIHNKDVIVFRHEPYFESDHIRIDQTSEFGCCKSLSASCIP